MNLSFDQIINKRRSIRKYRKEVPEDDLVTKMIFSASLAPSSKNSAPARFIRINSQKIRNDMEESMTQKYQGLIDKLEKGNHKKYRNIVKFLWRYSEFIFNAPVLFAVGTYTQQKGISEQLYRRGLSREYRHEEMAIDVSLGLAIANFILKGEELGLGSCILRAPFSFIEDINQILPVKDVKVKLFITLGYPDESPASITRKTIRDIYKEI